MSGTKRAASLLIVALMLCGCAVAEPSETTAPSVTTDIAAVTEVTEVAITTEITELTETAEATEMVETTESVRPLVQQEQTPTEPSTTQPIPETQPSQMPDHGIDLPDDVWDE